MDKDCYGCLDYENYIDSKPKCLSPGIGSRYEYFRKYICPCTDCLMKMVCSVDHRRFPYKCKLYSQARTRMFQELYGDNEHEKREM